MKSSVRNRAIFIYVVLAVYTAYATVLYGTGFVSAFIGLLEIKPVSEVGDFQVCGSIIGPPLMIFTMIMTAISLTVLIGAAVMTGKELKRVLKEDTYKRYLQLSGSELIELVLCIIAFLLNINLVYELNRFLEKLVDKTINICLGVFGILLLLTLLNLVFSIYGKNKWEDDNGNTFTGEM